MRKFISIKTLTIAKGAVTEQIEATDKGPGLLALYLAEQELAEAIAAAQQEPEPKGPKQKQRSRGNKAGPATEPRKYRTGSEALNDPPEPQS